MIQIKPVDFRRKFRPCRSADQNMIDNLWNKRKFTKIKPRYGDVGLKLFDSLSGFLNESRAEFDYFNKTIAGSWFPDSGYEDLHQRNKNELIKVKRFLVEKNPKYKLSSRL